jgi:hypothetical protein
MALVLPEYALLSIFPPDAVASIRIIRVPLVFVKKLALTYIKIYIGIVLVALESTKEVDCVEKIVPLKNLLPIV